VRRQCRMRSVRPAPWFARRRRPLRQLPLRQLRNAGNVIAHQAGRGGSKAKADEDKREIAASAPSQIQAPAPPPPAVNPFNRPNRWSSNHNWHSNRSTPHESKRRDSGRAGTRCTFDEKGRPGPPSLHSITRGTNFDQRPAAGRYLLVAGVPRLNPGFTIRRKSLPGLRRLFRFPGRSKELVITFSAAHGKSNGPAG